MADLAAEADLNRFALYARHGGKEGLFREVLELYRERVMARFTAPLDRRDAGLGAIHAFFAQFRERMADPRSRLGCLVCTTLAEGPLADPELQRQLVATMESLCDRFHRALERAREREEMNPAQDPRRLAEHLTIALLGLMTALRSPLPRSFIVHHIEAVLQFLESLALESIAPPTNLSERRSRWPRAGE